MTSSGMQVGRGKCDHLRRSRASKPAQILRWLGDIAVYEYVNRKQPTGNSVRVVHGKLCVGRTVASLNYAWALVYMNAHQHMIVAVVISIVVMLQIGPKQQCKFCCICQKRATQDADCAQESFTRFTSALSHKCWVHFRSQVQSFPRLILGLRLQLQEVKLPLNYARHLSCQTLLLLGFVYTFLAYMF